MLSTGIRTDVGVKVYGQNLDSIYAFSQVIKKDLEGIPGVKDLYVEPITGGKYIDVNINREEIARYNLSIDDVNAVIETALGGARITTTVEGRQRFSVNARFGQDYRNNIQALKNLQVQTPGFGPVPLNALADIKVTEGPRMINSENALLRGTVLFNVRGRDLGSTVQEAQQKLNASIGKMPKGFFVDWSGEYENLIRSEKTLKLIMPFVLVIIFISMYFAFDSAREALLSLISLPFALIGGAFIIYFWGVNLSVAVAVGFIALFGLAVETNIVMVIYLNDAMQQLVTKKARPSDGQGNSSETITKDDLREYTIHGRCQNDYAPRS